MHRRMCEQLLAEEVTVANGGRLRQRLDEDMTRAGTRIQFRASKDASTYVFALDGPNYDAEPLSLQVLDPAGEEPLPGREWPPGLYFGSDHPSLGRPFACLQGLLEYHTHHSHLDNPWDRHRRALRLDALVGHILNKAGL